MGMHFSPSSYTLIETQHYFCKIACILFDFPDPFVISSLISAKKEPNIFQLFSCKRIIRRRRRFCRPYLQQRKRLQRNDSIDGNPP